ncbi:hypothetical protein [Kitasatospora aureofaciens]|uniref:hypothetical protein n=1 Tax=Kitasatospora aureofaciens TaxID=1894 RepID=UPI0033E85E06
MAEERATEGEAQRVMDAVEVLKQMTDPQAQARAITQVLQAQPQAVKDLKAIRRQYVLAQRAAKVSFRAIAADLGVSVGVVQDIVRGYSGSGRDRPRTGKAGDAAEAAE